MTKYGQEELGLKVKTCGGCNWHLRHSLFFPPSACCINYLVHSTEQLNYGERLRNTTQTAAGIPGVTGHEENRQLRVKFQDAIRQVDAIHVRHPNVSQQHRNA